MKKHHNTHWLIHHTFINSLINRFGRLDSKTPTFTEELKIQLITKNPFIIQTDVAESLFDQSHVMFWKKRSSYLERVGLRRPKINQHVPCNEFGRYS